MGQSSPFHHPGAFLGRLGLRKSWVASVARPVNKTTQTLAGHASRLSRVSVMVAMLNLPSIFVFFSILLFFFFLALLLSRLISTPYLAYPRGYDVPPIQSVRKEEPKTEYSR